MHLYIGLNLMEMDSFGKEFTGTVSVTQWPASFSLAPSVLWTSKSLSSNETAWRTFCFCDKIIHFSHSEIFIANFPCFFILCR